MYFSAQTAGVTLLSESFNCEIIIQCEQIYQVRIKELFA